MRVKSVDEFIEAIASRSSTTGNGYQVKLVDGSTLSSRDWLTREWKSLSHKDGPPGSDRR